jgi:hypothetical protein
MTAVAVAEPNYSGAEVDGGQQRDRKLLRTVPAFQEHDELR